MDSAITIEQSNTLKTYDAIMPVRARQRAHSLQPGRFESAFILLLVKLRIIYFTCIVLRNPSRVWKAFKAMVKFRNSVWGGALTKMSRVDGKYYFSQFRPAWPSRIFDMEIKRDLLLYASPLTATEKLSFIFLAITRKCPMRCEHCFEWDNLNKKESFTKDDLIKVIDLYQQEDVSQFHFSGGEPMVRLKDLLELIKYASKKSDCWVLTSGFNFTVENAKLLKSAGCKGVAVSIDHYIPELHNLFRGSGDAFDLAVNAIEAAQLAGLVTTMSICATKQFIDGGHLMGYMDFAKQLGVQFVQVLEPRSVGHYEGKNVSLDEKHIVELEQIFKLLNHAPAYKNYPTIQYHGYHQRRIGCFSGSRSVYVDSAGDVHACPFCHTKSYNIIQLIRSKENKLPVKENNCPLFGKIA